LVGRIGDWRRPLKSTVAGLIATAVLLLVALPAAQGQPAVRVQRVGFVSPLPGSPEPPTLRAFREGLGELGYVEGKNIVVETRFAEGRSERFPELVAELISLKIDVLVVGSTVGALAAKRATTTIPIVFAGLIDPVAPGIVPSLARPGGNITGVTFAIGGSGFAGKWVELLKEAVPDVSHVAALWNSTNPVSALFGPELHAAGRALNVKVDLHDAGTTTKLDRALVTIGASGAQGIIVTNDPFFLDNRAKLLQFAARKRMPAVYFTKLFADAGGLMAYGGSLEESYRRAATYVDKILKGTKPANLPVEQPTRFEFIINLRAAKAIGFTVPQRVLQRADHVIE